ncbi:MAG: O-antigen ligase family protein [Oscillospiraceae bacterium]|nr:O-antigen ligase family protein [Oscillospiraceae bacterium]
MTNKNNPTETHGLFQTILSYLWWIVQQSIVYKVLTKFYSSISAQLQSSRILGKFRAEDTGRLTENSLWYRGTRKVFAFSDSKRLGAAVDSTIEGSMFIKSANYLLHNLLALNLKFIGYLAGTAVLINIIITAIGGSWPGIPAGAIAIVSFIFTRLDINVMAYLQDSAIVRFFEYTLDIKFNFEFFYKTKTKGNSRIMCAIIFGVFAGFISVLSPLFGVAFILGLAFMFMVFYKPIAGAFFAVFLAPIIPTMAIAGLCLLTLISLIINSITTRHFKWKFDFLGFLVMNLMLVLLISAATSFVRVTSLQIFAIYAIFISFYFVLTNLITSRKQLYALLTVFVISGLLVSLYGLMQYFFGIGTTASWVDEEMFATLSTRVYSTLENPNVLGTYLLLVIPVSIALMWSNKKPLTKIMFAGIVGIMFVTLLFTYSRGCWIAIMVAAAMYITFVKGKLWGLALLAIPFIPIILNLIPQNVIERITSIGNLEDTSSNYRLNIWLGSLNMLRDWWVSGIGLGTDAFMQVYPFYAFSGAFASHSHNLYMQIMIENGIIGFTLFILVIVFAFKSLAFSWDRSLAHPQWHARKKAHSDKLSTIPIALSAAIVGFMVQGIFDHALYNYRVFLMFWMVIAFASLCKFVAKEESAAKGDVAVD